MDDDPSISELVKRVGPRIAIRLRFSLNTTGCMLSYCAYSSASRDLDYMPPVLTDKPLPKTPRE